VRVTANGSSVEVAAGATVHDLLTTLGLGDTWVIVERNREPVARAELTTTLLVEDDRIELVRAVAGG